MTTNNELWIPPQSPKDQKKVDRQRKNLRQRFLKWTGFPDKTLWDWLQLVAALAIPVVIAAGTLWFSAQQSESSSQASEKQHQTDLQIAKDQQEENALQTYLDRMSDLLLNSKLRESQPGDEVRNIARARTITVLPQLNGERKGELVRFLYEAGLIDQKNIIISLDGADLSGASLNNADLSGASLNNANLNDAILSGATLNGANLNGANLRRADLREANLNGADLSGADLSGANFRADLSATLSGANLNGANLNGADLAGAYLNGAYLDDANLNDADLTGAALYDAELREANLTGANLNDADLTGAYLHWAHLNGAYLNGAYLNGAYLAEANVTDKQLKEAKSLQGATMPDGSKHP